jgi:hypothetical protein
MIEKLLRDRTPSKDSPRLRMIAAENSRLNASSDRTERAAAWQPVHHIGEFAATQRFCQRGKSGGQASDGRGAGADLAAQSRERARAVTDLLRSRANALQHRHEEIIQRRLFW